MPSVDQLKTRLEALLSKIGADSLTRERKQVARAGSQAELRLLGTGLRGMLGKRFGDRWDHEIDAVFGKTTYAEEPPETPAGNPESDAPSSVPPRFGTAETIASMRHQQPAERLESLRTYLAHAAQELLGENSAPMQQKIRAAAGLTELRGVVRAMAKIARLTHSEAMVERFIQKVGALFAAAEAGPAPPQ
jgi:hypothetical protein